MEPWKDLGTILMEPPATNTGPGVTITPYGQPEQAYQVPGTAPVPPSPQAPAQAPPPGMNPPSSDEELNVRKSKWKDFFGNLQNDPEMLATLMVIGNALANPQPGASTAGQFTNAMMQGMQYQGALQQVKELLAEKAKKDELERKKLGLEERRVAVNEGELARKNKFVDADIELKQAQADYYRHQKQGTATERERDRLIAALMTKYPDKFPDAASARVYIYNQSLQSKGKTPEQLAVEGWQEAVNAANNDVFGLRTSEEAERALDEAYMRSFGEPRRGRIEPPARFRQGIIPPPSISGMPAPQPQGAAVDTNSLLEIMRRNKEAAGK